MLKSILLLVFYLLSASALSVNTTSLLEPHPVLCFDRQPRIVLPDARDCQAAVDRIRREPRSDIPRRWFRPLPEYMLVERWNSGTCMIALLSRTAAARDVFKLALIADSASEIIDRCMTGFDHDGGRVTIGPREMFAVTVSGNMAMDLGTPSADTA